MRSFHSLRDFLGFCARRGELKVINRPVDRHLEICAIADREMKCPGGGHALLFTDVKGSRFPVAVNITGSARRIAWALGSETLAEVEARVRRLTDIEPPHSLRDAGALLANLAELRHVPPRRAWRAPCMDAVQPEVDLQKLPALTTWPEDGGPFLTLPMVFSRGDDGHSNCGMYRMQIHDRSSTGMHWQRHKGGRSQAQEHGGPLPAAVALGGPPVLFYAATAPLPPGIFEMLLAGFLQRRRVPMVRCRTCDLRVPAEADFVLEGEVDSEHLRREGPFGDHTGFYSQADDYPVFHVRRLSHRRDAVFPATVVGLPPVEDAWLGEATERIFLPLLQRVHGEITNMKLPIDGAFHNLALLGVKTRFPGHARKTFAGVWGTGQMMFTKYALAVRPGASLDAPLDLLEEIGLHWDVLRDTVRFAGPADTLDHAPNVRNFGSKLGIDATPKLPEEHREFPDAPRQENWNFPTERFSEVEEVQTPAGGRIVLLRITKTHAGQGRDLLTRLRPGDLPAHALFVVVGDHPSFLSSLHLAALMAFGNTDPGRDALPVASRRPGGCLGLDATQKLPEEGYAQGPWPHLITQDPAVLARVDSYAKEIWP